jgi:hypothetical protein
MYVYVYMHGWMEAVSIYCIGIGRYIITMFTSICPVIMCGLHLIQSVLTQPLLPYIVVSLARATVQWGCGGTFDLLLPATRLWYSSSSAHNVSNRFRYVLSWGVSCSP